MPDDLNRDNIYSARSDGDDDDDGLEYELEPPDADVLAAEQRLADEAVAAVQQSIDIDSIYREFEDRRDSEILRRWASNFRIRFQIKHMLIATAVLAIVLTLWKFGLLWGFLVWAIMLGVIGVTLYLQWREKLRQDEVDRRRRQMYAERRAHLRPRPAADQPAQVESAASAEPRVPAAAGPSLDEFEEVRQRAASKTFEFKFSLRQMLIALTCAAAFLGCVNLLGGPQNAATLLGFVALAGLVAHAFGYEPPGIVAFGWWILLVFYILLIIVAAVWSGFGA
jgi:hypothetical protein